ncbi:MAG: glycosyltransferase family 2 protein [Desulfitobacteriaceae bacterium]|nr:glycosyltransferase family 2 protein [Desulfitobacteriaceae bacterium]
MLEFVTGVLVTQVFNGIMIPVQVIIVFFTFYYFILSMFCLYRKKENKVLIPEKTFAIVVAAHNEEKVIEPLIDNLLQIDYPSELYDVFVVADNCTDKTALIARNAGASVHQRFNSIKKGKGFALEWMFHRLFKMERQYDAVVIFDADNLVKDNFLSEMNSKLCQGEKIIQCYLDSKNPFDTWVTITFSIAFWVTNRLLQLARYNIGLSNILGGTGMCISTDVLKQLGWGATSLTEDLEFSMKALSCGIKTSWAHDTAVYDEKSLTFAQSWRQRKRWAQGQVDVAGRYFFPLLLKGIKECKWTYIDAAVHLFQPALVMIATFFMLTNMVTALQPHYNTHLFALVMPWTGWQILSAIQYVYPIAALALDRLPWRAYFGLILYPVFLYSWVPIVFLGFLNCKDKQWSHTVHTRAISIKEVTKQKKLSAINRS